jgi:hypothetical protein
MGLVALRVWCVVGPSRHIARPHDLGRFVSEADIVVLHNQVYGHMA